MTQTVDAVAHARDWMEITAYQVRVDTHEAHEVAELLLADVDKLKKALLFYANPANYQEGTPGTWFREMRSMFNCDNGDVAMDALGLANADDLARMLAAQSPEVTP